MIKLHLGSGGNYIEGWINIDTGSKIKVDECFDLRNPLPYQNNSINFIYNEHFIEHLTYDQGFLLLKECYRVLMPTGVLRISTPNLEWIVEKYVENNITEWANIRFNPISKCFMLNESLRRWGHQFVYDPPELKNILRLSGFHTLKQCEWRKSNFSELSMLESRLYHKEIIIEATK